MRLPRPALVVAIVPVLVPVLAACARRATPAQESAATERPVADPAAAYACAAAAAQGMGYAVPAEVLDRGRGEGRIAGGSFTAERRLPRDGRDAEVAQLFVRVRSSRDDGGTLRVAPWRYEELYTTPPTATSAPTVPPRMAPVATIAGDRRREEQSSGRRGRMRRTLPAGPVAEDAATVVLQCAG